MKVGKPKSKRVSTRLRHKIEKASASKQRKQRKEAKKDPQWRSRLKKDPGIPNLFPYKAKVLAEIEDGRRRKEEEMLKRREVAKAQRTGAAIAQAEQRISSENDDEDDLTDHTEDLEGDGDQDMEVQHENNPMAALLASAQARADAYRKQDSEDDEGEDNEDDDRWDSLEAVKATVAPKQPIRKVLPKQALADPIKAVTILFDRMQATPDGMERLIGYYQIPPVITSGTDLPSRFLVEVARKRGRLGRGGVPNLHAAALIVLGDLNEERLQLPAVEELKKPRVVGSKGEVQIVTKMAEPFRIEGLWADNEQEDRTEPGGEMVVED